MTIEDVMKNYLGRCLCTHELMVKDAPILPGTEQKGFFLTFNYSPECKAGEINLKTAYQIFDRDINSNFHETSEMKAEIAAAMTREPNSCVFEFKPNKLTEKVLNAFDISFDCSSYLVEKSMTIGNGINHTQSLQITLGRSYAHTLFELCKYLGGIVKHIEKQKCAKEKI